MQNRCQFLPSMESDLTFPKYTVKYASSRSVDEGDCIQVLVKQSENAVNDAANDEDVYANVDVRFNKIRYLDDLTKLLSIC